MISFESSTSVRKRQYLSGLTVMALLLISTLPSTQSSQQNTEGKLLRHIRKNTSINARPVINASTPVRLKFGIQVVQIISVDERSHKITTKLWVYQSWTDELVSWNASVWGGVDRLNVDPETVWKPDVVLYNNAGEKFSGGSDKYKTLVSIYPDGKHTWFSPAIFTSTCKIDVKYFPFDKQVCSLKFGSWAFDSTKIDLDSDGSPVLTSAYLNSSEWDITNVQAKLNSVKYKCCPHPFLDMTFTIGMKRRPLYYIFNVVAPCIILVLMVLFSFLVPPDSGERLSLNITVMLTLAVFLQALSESLPKNSDSTPLLSIFYMTLMAECACALVSTIFVLAVHHKGDAKGAIGPSAWIRQYFLKVIPREIGYRNMSMRRDDMSRENKECDISSLYDKYKCFAMPSFTKNKNCHKSVQFWNKMKRKRETSTSKHDDILLHSLQDILKEVDLINESIKEKEENEEVEEEWKMLGKVIDRLLFFGFLFVFLLSAMGTLMQVYK